MQRGKSFKEAQSQSLREVIAEFDLQTAINRIAVRCFNDILQDNKQAFEYLNQNEKRMGDIQLRITKMEGFAGSIQNKLNSKMEVTKSLGDRLEVFNKQFYENMKQSQNTIQSMRKDYDLLVSSSQKNSYQLRSIKNELKQMNANMKKTDNHVDQEITKLIAKIGQDTNKLQQQIIDERKSTGQLSISVIEARAQLQAANIQFKEVSKDVALYKNERLALDRRIKDAVDQIMTKASKDQMNQMRLFFDSQLTTDKTYNGQRFLMINEALADEIKNRTKQDEVLKQQAIKKWSKQESTNSQLKKTIDDIRKDIIIRDNKMVARVNKIQSDLRVQLEALSLREVNDVNTLIERIQKILKQHQLMQQRACNIQNFQKQRHSELIQLTSSFTGLNDTVNGIIDENERRKQDLQKLSADNSNMGDMNSSLQKIREQIIQQRRNVQALKQSIIDILKKQDKTANDLIEKDKIWSSLIFQQKKQNQHKLTQINRRISSVSIQIMSSLQKSERQAKQYTDLLRNDLTQKLQIMDQVKKDMEKLKQAFAEQMAETSRLNKALAQKMDRINAVMTKIKSDLTIKIQSAMNELQRRGIEIRQIGKMLEDLRKYISYMNESLSIVLAVSIARQVNEDPSGEPIKISSLLEGWVFETQDKLSRYRSETIPRKRLLWVALNFMSSQGDRVKGTVIESGKDVFHKMMDETDIFTARKRVLSKRGGSELPKLYM